MNVLEKKGDLVPLSFLYCVKWWYYYHTKTVKGKFEVYHFIEWLLLITGCVAILEMGLYLWLSV